MKLKGILFDFDGTLIDTSGLIIASLQHTARVHCGKELSEQELRPILGRTIQETMHILAPEQSFDALAATYREHQIANAQRMSVFPAVKETLRALSREKVQLAIVTSRRRETALEALRRFDMAEYFSVIIGAHQCKKHKPDPEPLQRALKSLSLEAQDCMMVGDSPADLAGAHNAGMPAAAVRWSYLDWPLLAAEDPEYILDSMADLKKIALGE